MHILHFNTTARCGGAARAMYRLHRAMKEQGHTPATVARLSDGLPDADVHQLAALTQSRHRPGNCWLAPAGRLA